MACVSAGQPDKESNSDTLSPDFHNFSIVGRIIRPERHHGPQAIQRKVMTMKLIEQVQAHIKAEQRRLSDLLARLEWLERLWDERVTRLLADYPAPAGDCAWHRDAARQRAAVVQQRLGAYERVLTCLPA